MHWEVWVTGLMFIASDNRNAPCEVCGVPYGKWESEITGKRYCNRHTYSEAEAEVVENDCA